MKVHAFADEEDTAPTDVPIAEESRLARLEEMVRQVAQQLLLVSNKQHELFVLVQDFMERYPKPQKEEK